MKRFVPAVDQRALQIRHLETQYDLPRFRTLSAWCARAAELRTHIKSVCGFIPVPPAPPLKAKVFDTIEYPDYAVSKVFFQSHPGLLVTGNLFVPRGKKGPFPAVLNPHGHWQEGRLVQNENGNILARGISFARQGYVALCYDMVGFNDSTQFAHFVTSYHESDSDQQILWGFSRLALQLYNSIRAVDFLQSLPTVDPERIGCTGESGGGSQTFLLTAVDDRVKVSAPVNMISSHMQGGCRCENTASLRIDTTSPEIAALMAPRPMLMVAATGDWTKDTPTVEYPFMQSIYKLYGAADCLEMVQMDAPHNYNLASRNAVYRFFGKWLLGVDDPEVLQEQPFRLAAKKKYLVFATRKRPDYAPDGEKLMETFIKRRKTQLRKMLPTNRRELQAFQTQIAPAMQQLIHATVPSRKDLLAVSCGKTTLDGIAIEELILSRPEVGDRVPALLLKPPLKQRTPHAALVASPVGGSGLVDVKTGEISILAAELLATGKTFLLIDCWGKGEAQIPPERDEAAGKINFFEGYNRSDDMNRIQDILTGLGYLRSLRGIEHISLLGLGYAGLWTLLARTQAPFVERTVIDLAQFNANKDEDYLSRLQVPLIRSIGGLEAAVALIAPGALCLYRAGAGFNADAIIQTYAAAGKKSVLSIEKSGLTPAEIARRL